MAYIGEKGNTENDVFVNIRTTTFYQIQFYTAITLC